MKLRLWQAPGVLHHLAGRFEPWLSCDDCFDQADQVIEDLVIRGSPLPEPFQAHLRGCPACREEAETLAGLVAADNGIEPALALARLDSQVSTGL